MDDDPEARDMTPTLGELVALRNSLWTAYTWALDMSPEFAGTAMVDKRVDMANGHAVRILRLDEMIEERFGV